MTSDALTAAIDQFADPRGYLAVASIGLPTRHSVAAMTADLAAWYAADRDPQGYDAVIARTRAAYAGLVAVPVEAVAIGSQTSVITSLIADAAPDGAEVVVVAGDFSSIEFPFVARPGIRLRAVELDALADALTDETWLVAFSLVQSATGRIADTDAILEAARRHDVLTLCDTTQAVGVLPVDASPWDATICHSYKWLCSPRGVAFLTLRSRLADLLVPTQAGWYAGDDPWANCYGPAMSLATDARRFDVSPAWQAWVGAEPAITMFGGLDIAEVWQRASGLGDMLCDALGIDEQHQAIVTWPDPDGAHLALLIAAGIRVSGRAGRLRAAFHLWNDESDVDRVAAVLHEAGALRRTGRRRREMALRRRR
ncbi:aminotransferase class V-fold PLP-dependent enzyme [Herbiconiux sp. L3-i23]|uniref:aminotransferase class V-fold PLP-dependent enzyme n=1 Tax=Herbiconiux sp. L3-i23 TaxID=2905871 RepID=UPI0020492C80|nr:aminotransferase class V-fold PLP-dependent enzyme [Herbiconiux sp. L3-i23]BDI23047.1 aminotransferase class V [Herbiconiux sp. L3-i23]